MDMVQALDLAVRNEGSTPKRVKDEYILARINGRQALEEESLSFCRHQHNIATNHNRNLHAIICRNRED